jgi:hypothetical protein
MKSKFIVRFLLLMSFAGASLQAQGTIAEETEGTEAVFNSNAQQANFFLQQSVQVLDPNAINVANTGVFIRQVGSDNRNSLVVQSRVSNVQLSQLGNTNTIDLNLSADVVDYSVIQNGNNNFLLEYNRFVGKQLIERSVQQNGNNQNLTIHGNNGIVDRMKINMGEGSQSLIIRNTN